MFASDVMAERKLAVVTRRDNEDTGADAAAALFEVVDKDAGAKAIVAVMKLDNKSKRRADRQEEQGEEEEASFILIDNTLQCLGIATQK